MTGHEQGKIIEAKEIYRGVNGVQIEWISENGGFGQLSITHIEGTGDYKIDAEFISLESVEDILKVWLNNK
jgi:hypothetical protein